MHISNHSTLTDATFRAGKFTCAAFSLSKTESHLADKYAVTPESISRALRRANFTLPMQRSEYCRLPGLWFDSDSALVLSWWYSVKVYYRLHSVLAGTIRA
jgi:hypothetical protein